MTATRKVATAPSLRERAHDLDLWPTEDGPWHPCTDDRTQIYDNGLPWCSSADCHPNSPGNNRYPRPDHPAAECRSWPGVSLDEVRAELDGEELRFSVYAAHPFAFGEQRPSGQTRTKVVFEFAVFSDDDAPEQRFSMSLGDALILARHLEHVVDVVRYNARDRV